MVQKILLYRYSITDCTHSPPLLYSGYFQFFTLMNNSVIISFVYKFLSMFLFISLIQISRSIIPRSKDILVYFLKSSCSKTRNYLRLFSTKTLPTGWLTPVGIVNTDCCSGLLCSSVIMSSSSTPSSLAYCNSASWVFLRSEKR